ncbi:putative inorganic carbon transporter subunit DabA [Micromonospora auratinigra]|uniref:Probable inorganic carbon transporter subunit DabA n=1 Tax=Micromonospora auratinigra TaxID=261654 RepID=A0A1A8Z7M7_9ACTN|nr:putative inorganic carbon transporter subunit DabA [Micromonospora auratinigra]SBT39870.1 hypothetical protein GA0070611_1056 [Micromonospora auratinigra]
MTIALITAVLAAPALASLSALVTRDSRHAARVTGPLLALAAGGAVLLLAVTAVDGPVTGTLLRPVVADVPVSIGVRVDRFVALFVLLVCGIAAAVSGYARRYLDGDPRAAAFQARVAGATAATLLMATAPNLGQLALGWVLAGRLLAGLIGHHRDRPRVRDATRRVRRLFLAADLALVGGLVLLAVGLRAGDLAAVRDAAADAPPGLLVPAGLLLLAAGMVRSAQVPVHGWLPSTLDAPTPVSAFLHAGMVNVVGFLLITLAPVFVAAPGVLAVALLVGLLTAAAGTLFGAVRTDAKGALARSTVAQMGFMLAQCGLGAFGLAAVHLVGHGVFKAYAFLSAGGAVRQHAQAADAPRPAGPTPTQRLVLAGGVLLAVVALVEVALGASLGGLLSAALAVAAGTGALAGALADRLLARRQVATVAAAVVAACVGYLLLGRLAERWLRLPSAVSPAAVAVAAVVLAGIATTAWLVARRPTARLWWWAWRDGYPGRWWRPSTTAVTPAVARSTVRDTDAAVAVASAATAADLVGQAWPVDTFVAVNPLAGLERLPFTAATDRLRTVAGARTHLTAQEYRRRLHAGDIEETDLAAALTGTPLEGGAALLPDGRLVTGPELRELVLRRPVHDGPPPPADLLAAVRRRLAVAPPAPADPDSGYAEPTLAERLDRATGGRLAEQVDDLVAGWCAAYCGQPAARWPVPGGDAEGSWARWRRTAGGDTLPRLLGVSGFADFVTALPAAPEAALALLLRQLGVPASGWSAYLSRSLVRLPGWAGHARWWSAHRSARPGLSVVELLAIRLAYEVALGDATARRRLGVPGRIDTVAAGTPERPDQALPVARLAAALDLTADGIAALGAPALAALRDAVTDLSAQRQAEVWLAAAEHAYRRRLRAQLDRRTAPADAGAPLAQAVFCIDVRSEGLRRHLEAAGPVETFGFAGFFGLPLRTVSPDARAGRDRCPVLMSPVATVTGPEPEPARVAGRRLRQGWRRAVSGARGNPVGAFAFVEIAGLVAAGALLARAVAPARLAGDLSEPAPTAADLARALTLDERVYYAEATLRAMGLTDRFAPLLLLCGHGASTVNNPYAAALDCGACGGNRGGVSARMAAAMLNDPAVRAGLARRGVGIPAGTHVLAAEHDTVTDEVRLTDVDAVPATHRGAVEELSRLLDLASAALRRERADRLPDRPAAGRLPGRATDWAQVRPEWALAGNAAFIAGPRARTAGLDLGCRTFLHSYDWSTDPDAASLETILTGPLVVAQWINMQYYFASVDPERFGAGDKTVHTVLGDGLGVLSGSGGDLRTGLPRQSVGDGQRLVHEPLRLLAVVHAPYPMVAAVLRRNPALRDLVDGHWLHLCAVDPDTGLWWEPAGGDAWRPVPAPAATAPAAPTAAPAVATPA